MLSIGINLLIFFSSELQSQHDTAAADLKEERIDNKRLKADLQRVRDELEEVKAEKETVDKVECTHTHTHT